MNTTLAIHFEQDYLIAAVEPLLHKFQQITKRKLKQFPFYFFIDKLNQKIDYSFVYKQQIEAEPVSSDSNKRIISDFINLITDRSITYEWYGYKNKIINLLLEILDDVKNGYFHILNSKLKAEINEKDAIPLSLSFADSISPESVIAIKTFLRKQNFTIKQEEKSMPELLVKEVIRSKKLSFSDRKFAVIESTGEDLNMSIIAVYNEYDRERLHFKSFSEHGIDPRVQVIAKKIVDDINKQAGLLNSDEACKAEYKRQYCLAEKLVAKIEKSNRPYLDVETTFSNVADTKLKTVLSIEETERLTSFHIRQISRYFEDHFVQKNNMQVEQFERVILIGDMLNNEMVKKEFSRFNNNHLIYLTDNDLSYVLHAQLFTEAAKTANKNSSGETSGEYRKVEFLTISNLQSEQKVRLQNNDPTPGKGDSVQEFQYLGENRFVVLQSTRSLQPGDIATVTNPAWVPGIQAELNIERNGKILGRFRTRTIVAIEMG